VGILSCPVRNCGEPLDWGERLSRCPRGHSFDRARSGYVNLLQPQDKRSKAPGDTKATAQARRRSLERGLGNALRDAVRTEIAAGSKMAGTSGGSRLLDVGCGEGFYLRSIDPKFERWGVDLSSPSLELAAAADPSGHYIAANADRRLPFFDHVFPFVASLTGPKAPAEFARVLAPDGRLLLATAGSDDLCELRELMLGRATPLEHAAAAKAKFEPLFRLERQQALRQRVLLDAAGLADVLATTYRGARTRERAKLDGVSALEVTVSHVLLVFRART
jgi:23S rRNA (guanine745-N1)-methyltransferase